VERIVLACCALHNYLRARNGSRDIYSPPASFDRENLETGEVMPGDWRTEHVLEADSVRPIRPRDGFISQDPLRIREQIADYFMNEGQLSFQERMCTEH